MGGTGSSAFPPIGRYLSGLCVAALGLCAAGWLALTPLAFGYRGRGWHDAALTDLTTGGGLAAVCLITLTAWAVAWRRRAAHRGRTEASAARAGPDAAPAGTRRRWSRRRARSS